MYQVKNGCPGCGACDNACPVNAIRHKPGNVAMEITGDCMGCGVCASKCPIGLITKKPVKKEDAIDVQ